ncbi:putative endoglucanase X 2 [Colletotrichum chlorophyti]|uniref:Putative endoglucanase X 2 n=1 Tax=Colletotrichum chlorophyti TaxID=708187 RepID=A0A1Q8RM50_9PEZI|nr:putative endoglucanase X 2 [Colletotrichum chlorophyti]
MRLSAVRALVLFASAALAETKSLKYKDTPLHQIIKENVQLRILPVGDSITVGYLSSDGNGYRLKLQQNLFPNDLAFVGTETSGDMNNGNYAAWSGRTIKYIADNVGPSLAQRPNIILLHAGTNDMNSKKEVSTEGNDPAGAAERLGSLIDQMIAACPDATILVAQIIAAYEVHHWPAMKEYQKLIPEVVEQRRNASHHVIAVDFASIGQGVVQLLDDNIHPSDKGYQVMGDYWYDFITQIPKDWISQPVDVKAAGEGTGGGNTGGENPANAEPL